MKKYYCISFILLLSFANNFHAQELIAVQHLGESSFFHSLQEALDSADAGDSLIVPGGIYTLPLINKPVHIIGAGYHPDSTTATGRSIVMGGVIYTSEASGGSLEGFFLSNGLNLFDYISNTDLTNYHFKRCFIYGLIVGADFSGSPADISFTECVLSIFTGGNKQAFTFSNCVVLNRIEHISIGSIVRNCTFLRSQTSDGLHPIMQMHQTLIQNNIILDADVNNSPGITECYIESNVLVNTLDENSIWYTSWGNFFFGNTDGVDATGLFVNYPMVNANPGLNDYFELDLHLSPVSPALGAGNGGTDAGIYGGVQPFKDGGVPSIPHIQFKDIAGQTDENGNLHVVVKASAQDN